MNEAQGIPVMVVTMLHLSSSLPRQSPYEVATIMRQFTPSIRFYVCTPDGELLVGDIIINEQR